MDRQPVLAESSWQDRHHPLGILRLGESDDEVVRVADEVGPATQTGLNLPLKPVVQQSAVERPCGSC